MEKKPKDGFSGVNDEPSSRAYIAAANCFEDRERRKYRCIEAGYLPNDFTNAFLNHFGFIIYDKKPKDYDLKKYHRTEQSDPTKYK
jgi:hypothetical protein